MIVLGAELLSPSEIKMRWTSLSKLRFEKLKETFKAKNLELLRTKDEMKTFKVLLFENDWPEWELCFSNFKRTMSIEGYSNICCNNNNNNNNNLLKRTFLRLVSHFVMRFFWSRRQRPQILLSLKFSFFVKIFLPATKFFSTPLSITRRRQWRRWRRRRRRRQCRRSCSEVCCNDARLRSSKLNVKKWTGSRAAQTCRRTRERNPETGLYNKGVKRDISGDLLTEDLLKLPPALLFRPPPLFGTPGHVKL